MTYPRFIHAEFMTHRDRARNAASSRAIPWTKMKDMIMTEPVIPLSFDAEQKGMQSGAALDEGKQQAARQIWLEARDAAVGYADELARLGVHKSLCNRITEPFMWITVLCTATQWNNFFRLRCHPAAEKHFQKIAGMVRDAIKESVPKPIGVGGWHCPYLTDIEQREMTESLMTGDIFWAHRYKQYSVARCARLSYLTHDGTMNPEADLKLVAKLLAPPGDPDEEVMHASPFEHVAEAVADPNFRSGPFFGWKQYRKEFPNECLD